MFVLDDNGPSEDYFETQTSSSAVRSTRNGGAAWIMTQYLTGLDPVLTIVNGCLGASKS